MAKAATQATQAHATAKGGWLEQLAIGIAFLAVAFAAVLVFLVASGLIAPDELIADPQWRERLLGFADSGTTVERAATASASALIGLGALALLFRRAGARSPAAAGNLASTQHILLADDEGMVLVATEGIAAVAETAAVRSHGVLEADVSVRGRGSSPVRIHVTAHAYRGADLKRAGSETRENVRSAVQRLVGVEVTEVTVEIGVSEEVGRGVA